MALEYLNGQARVFTTCCCFTSHTTITDNRKSTPSFFTIDIVTNFRKLNSPYDAKPTFSDLPSQSARDRVRESVQLQSAVQFSFICHNSNNSIDREMTTVA
ncbi:hypothetical protein AVEN_198629-1 [Araneus ventricosus]|uniref:Uncharacterized protein n=1 Tax=Araneus ventricosus TaxID=182803 RepID=A0A4Y2HY87_ARAVE|nr:hypothetical protein AVEN_198629-1 [Araneus ventricosus]